MSHRTAKDRNAAEHRRGWRLLQLLAVSVPLATAASGAMAQSSDPCAAFAALPLYRLEPAAVLAACPADGDEQAMLQRARVAAQANNAPALRKYGEPLFATNASAALPLLGYLAEVGLGRARDSNEAFFVYRLASQRAVPGAAAGFGRVALELEELSRLKPEAIAAMQSAVAAGDSSAIEPLAQAYLSGTGLPRSPREALRLVRLGVLQNDPESTYLLGAWTLNGTLVSADRQEALTLFRRAALAGEPRALFALGFYGSGGNADSAARNLLEGYSRTTAPTERLALYQRLRRMDSAETRLAVQRLLTEAGFDTGGLDGDLGRRSRQALEDYRAWRFAWPEPLEESNAPAATPKP